MTDQSKTFGEICHDCAGEKWITLFYERKGYTDDFPRISQDAIVVFCKLFDPGDKSLTYLGYIPVEQTISCSDLLREIAKMAEVDEERSYNVFVEEENCVSKEITGTQLSVSEVCETAYQL